MGGGFLCRRSQTSCVHHMQHKALRLFFWLVFACYEPGCSLMILSFLQSRHSFRAMLSSAVFVQHLDEYCSGQTDVFSASAGTSHLVLVVFGTWLSHKAAAQLLMNRLGVFQRKPL